jgi:voltage-gated potassium channel
VLREAGVETASAVIVTTHDDDMNVYLTLYCRRLRPEVLLLGRVNSERNLVTIHRAGADFALSYATTGAVEAWNALRSDSTLVLAEGLIVFRVPIPPALGGRRLADLDIPEDTGCHVIDVVVDGQHRTGTDPTEPLPHAGDLLLIGDDAAEERFLARYVVDEPGRLAMWWRRRGGRTDVD